MSYYLLSRLRPLRASAILFTNIVSAFSGFHWQHPPHHLSLQRQLVHHQDVSCYVSMQCPSMHTRGLTVAATGRGHEFVDDENIISAVRSSLRDDLIRPHIDTISTTKTIECSQDITTVVLLLAVSGGSDSVALFHAVTALLRKTNDDSTQHASICLDLDNDGTDGSKEVKCELHVAHFNHEQRGDNSDGDEAFVQRLCAERDIPFHNYFWSDEEFSFSKVERNDENAISGNSFTQDIARKWRRRKLRDLLSDLVLQTNNNTMCDTNRWGAILTAHHGDDSDETILLKLVRGSHLSNLRGMEARSEKFDLATDSSSSSSTCVGYFAKPMLQLRKNDITKFLESNALEWREDESNATNKYKRNKVRNELIPLMRELAGGEQALQKRFNNIDQQSRAISKDLKERATSYLASMPSQSEFWLPGDEVDILCEEAFYIWASKVTDRKLQLSYDQINRIKFQVENYPGKLQWTIDVGDLWRVQRNGNVLTLVHETESISDSLPWYIVETNHVLFDVNDQLESDTELIIKLPPKMESSSLSMKRVKDVGNMRFLPQWRKGRSPIKIKELLRGQKIPLHLRDETSVLCISVGSEDQIVAVYIQQSDEDANGKWIIHSDFEPTKGNSVTRITLGTIN